MSEREPLRRGVSIAVASAAVVVGHRLAYMAAFPDPAARELALRGAGHGYFGFLTDVAILLGGAAAAAAFLSRLTRPGEPVPRTTTLSVRLAALQCVAFVAMEVTERVASGAPVASVLAHHLLPIGIGVQAVVALAEAILIRALLAAADEVGRAARSATPVPPARGSSLVPVPVGAPAWSLAGPTDARSPPLPPS
jgi:hypothetical protein